MQIPAGPVRGLPGRAAGARAAPPRAAAPGPRAAGRARAPLGAHRARLAEVVRAEVSSPPTSRGSTLVRDLWTDLAIRYADDPTAPEPKGESDDLQLHELEAPTGTFVVVYDDDGIGARLRRGAPPRRRRRARSSACGCRPSTAGRGVSRVVLAALEIGARTRLPGSCVLETGVRQPEAIALYESAGYTLHPELRLLPDPRCSVCYRKGSTAEPGARSPVGWRMARIALPDGDGPEVVRALSLRPEFAKAVGGFETAVWGSSLDWRLHELVRMQVAMINECTVCLGWRTPAGDRGGRDRRAARRRRHLRDVPGLHRGRARRARVHERFCTDSARITDDLHRTA